MVTKSHHWFFVKIYFLKGVEMTDKVVFCELWGSLFIFSLSLSASLPDTLLFSELSTDPFYCVFN